MPEDRAPEAARPSISVARIILVLGLLLGFLAERELFFPLRGALEQKSDLAVTASIESGTLIEIFLNGQFDRSFTAHIQPGRMATYLFHDVPSSISFIRLDVTDSGNAHVAVKDISLISNGAVAGSIQASELKKWSSNQLVKDSAHQEDDVATFVTESNDPYLYSGGLTLAAPDESRPFSIREFVLQHLDLLVAGLACLILIASRIGLTIFLPAVALLGITSYAVRKVAWHCLQLHVGTPQISQAVGNAGFHGYVKLPEQLAFTAGLAAIICSGLALGLLFRRWNADSTSEATLAHQPPFSLWKVLSVIALFVVLDFPNLATARVAFLHTELSDSGFDWANVFAWDFLYHYGFLPFRDYWFPYGGDYSQMGTAPTSLWFTYIVQCVLFSALFVSLYEICNRRVLVALAVLLPAGILIHMSVLQGTKRYFAALGAVLGFCALWKAKPRGMFPAAVFGAYLGWVFAREPNQLIYAAPALGVIGLFFLLEPHHNRRFRRRVAQLITIASVFLVAVALNCSLLFIRGQLPEFLAFYAHMSAMGAAVSIPAPIIEWYSLSPKYENLLLLSMHVIAGLGAYFVVRKEMRQFGLLLLGLALLESMIFYKMLLRPHMAKQIIGISVVAAGIYLSHWARSFRGPQLFAGAYLFGTGFGYLAHEGVIRDLAAEYQNRAETFSSNLEVLLDGTDLSREDFDSYYKLPRFTGLDEDTIKLTEYVQSKEFPRFGGKFYVFGNESFLYALLKEKPCPYISFYDGSSVFAQQRTLRCLAEQRPQLIAWNSANKIFDDVPNEVRVPLLFDYVVAHFAPETKFGRFQVLRQRDEHEPIDWGFWRAQLGDSIHLGAIPRFSSYQKLKTCREGNECFDFAELPSGSSGPVLLHAGSQTFSIHFDPLTADQPGYINLSRIWFWNAAEREGLTPSIEMGGQKINRERRRAKSSVLY